MTTNNPNPTIGEAIQFNVIATNNGPGNAQGVVVQDLLPSGYTFVSKTVFNGTYDETTGIWSVGNIPATGIAQIFINATVKATGSYTNTATRTASTPTDPVAGNNSASLTPTPSTTADVAMSMTTNNPNPTIGEAIQFNVIATNNGPGNAQGVVVQDLLPSGYTFVSKTVFNGTYDETTGIWSVGNIPATGIAQIFINATVKATGSYTNTATRTASNPTDPVAGNNSASLTPTPSTTADVAMSMTTNNPNPTIGEAIQFVVVATNNGPGNAQGVVVQDLLPSGYTFVSEEGVQRNLRRDDRDLERRQHPGDRYRPDLHQRHGESRPAATPTRRHARHRIRRTPWRATTARPSHRRRSRRPTSRCR